MKTCVLVQRFNVQNLCEKKGLESFLLTDGFTMNGVFEIVQDAVNNYKKWWLLCLISESKVFKGCFDIISLPEIALILKYSH